MLVYKPACIITRFKSRCWQLDTHTLMYSALFGGGWGLSAHKVGPSHATRRGWGLLTNRPSSFFSSPFFLFFSPSSSSFLLLSPFIKKQKRVSYRQMPAHSAQAVSHATLVRYCVSCACSYVGKKKWEREGLCARACVKTRRHCA